MTNPLMEFIVMNQREWGQCNFIPSAMHSKERKAFTVLT